MHKTKPTILGVRIDNLTISQAVQQITAYAASTDLPARYVVKPYVEFFDRAYRDGYVKNLLNQAWLRLPDGVSTQWAAAYLNGRPSIWRFLSLTLSIMVRPQAISYPIAEKFGGTVFTWKLLEACAEQRLKVYLIGSPRRGDIAGTVKVIKEQLPNLDIVGDWPGHWGGMKGEQLRQRLQHAPLEAKLYTDLGQRRPDIILVGMGFPLQEELMAKLTPQLHHGILIGEGGTFDYASFGGIRTKAPAWIQRSGLEWLWRLVLEPSRWQRQLAVPRFMWAVYQSSRAKTTSNHH